MNPLTVEEIKQSLRFTERSHVEAYATSEYAPPVYRQAAQELLQELETQEMLTARTIYRKSIDEAIAKATWETEGGQPDGIGGYMEISTDHEYGCDHQWEVMTLFSSTYHKCKKCGREQ